MRSRNLKPGFFKNEDLVECDPLARILFEGLWCFADREGRFEWRPKKMKIEILPCDNCDIGWLLGQLELKELIIKYSVNGKEYGHLPTFLKHQNPHVRESPSTCPDPTQALPRQDKEDKPRTNQGTTKEKPRPRQDCLNPESLLLNASSSDEETPKEKNPSTEKGIDSQKSTKGDTAPEIKIPLKNGEDFIVEENHLEELKNAYPDVDITLQILRIRNWNVNNPKKRKTPGGVKDHIEKWIKDEQKKIDNQKALKEAMSGGFTKDLKKEINQKSERARHEDLKRQVREMKGGKT